MKKTVEFFFDLCSPGAYLAWTQLPDLCRYQEAQLVCRPMLQPHVFHAEGQASPSTRRYAELDISRFARRYGIPFTPNHFATTNTLHLMRAATSILIRQPDRFAQFVVAAFTALWVDGMNPLDPATINRTFIAAGFRPDDIPALTNDADASATLQRNTDEAIQRGVFATPTMFVGTEMFFGHDRLDFVDDELYLM